MGLVGITSSLVTVPSATALVTIGSLKNLLVGVISIGIVLIPCPKIN